MTNTETLSPRRFTRRIGVIACVVAASLLGACESDPIDPGHEEGDVAGFRLDEINLELPGGVTRQTLFTYTGPESVDTLVLDQGRTTEIEIVWLDADGGVVEPDEDEHGWIFADNHSAIASVDVAETGWTAQITTVPLLPGATVYGTFSVSLLHGVEEEFETAQLVAAVTGD